MTPRPKPYKCEGSFFHYIVMSNRNGEYGVEKVKALIAATPVGEIMKRHQGCANNGSLVFFRYLH